MTISKRITDGVIIDFNALVISLWGSAELLMSNKEPEKDRAKKRLEYAKKDIEKLEEDEGLFIEGLKHYYYFNSDEIQAIELSKFGQYIKEIEKGNLDNIINALKNLNNALEKKINNYFSPRRFEGAYL
jgi:hypothetical protein